MSASSSIKQQLFIMKREIFNENGKQREQRQDFVGSSSLDEEVVERQSSSCTSRGGASEAEHGTDTKTSSSSTIFCNSLGSLKILEMALASSIVACLWSQCRFTYYASGYCYGPASAFQLQNFPIFVSLFSIVANVIVLLVWMATWEQQSVVITTTTHHNPDDGTNNNKKSKRKKVAQADTICSLFFILLNIGALIVEIWMVIKYERNYSCPMCYTLALWSIAAACLAVNTILYIYNAFICLHQHRLNAFMRNRF